MDAIVGDRFLRGRRLRPATADYAAEQFPRLIYNLKLNRLKITTAGSSSGQRVVWLESPHCRRDSWVILESDFIRCRDIAGEVNISLFPDEKEKDVLARIRALVQVRFI